MKKILAICMSVICVHKSTAMYLSNYNGKNLHGSSHIVGYRHKKAPQNGSDANMTFNADGSGKEEYQITTRMQRYHNDHAMTEHGSEDPAVKEMQSNTYAEGVQGHASDMPHSDTVCDTSEHNQTDDDNTVQENPYVRRSAIAR